MLAIIFVIIEILLRLAPHIPNFSPVTATALFGGVYINKKFALLVPLIGLAISDYLLYPQYMFHSDKRKYLLMSLMNNILKIF